MTAVENVYLIPVLLMHVLIQLFQNVGKCCKMAAPAATAGTADAVCAAAAAPRGPHLLRSESLLVRLSGGSRLSSSFQKI